MHDTPAKVLVVDDEPALAQVTAELLRREHFLVDTAGSGREALERVQSGPPDVMILDFELPDMNALQVMEHLRSRNSGRMEFPVLILTGARTATLDQVLGLELGAADYVLKGTDSAVLLARVRRLVRDKRSGDPGIFQIDTLRLDVSQRRAWVGHRELKLERKSFDLLSELAHHHGEVVSRAQLLERVWQTDFRGFEHALEQAIYTLRKALGKPSWILTVPGHGYRFVGEE